MWPVRRLPRLGWVVTDAPTARRILNDHAHFTLLGEGGVGHLWAQVLGDWVERLFDGPGHASLRSRARDLFTEDGAASLVARVFDPEVGAITGDLAAGRAVDLADRSRVLVGRMVVDLLGLQVAEGGGAYRRVFASGERLAALALGTTASTVVAPDVVWFGAGRHLCLGAPVARAELANLLAALVGLGRPWRVVERRPARRVLIPSYASLHIELN